MTEVMPDVYVNAVLHALRGRPGVTDVILGRDGRWRVSEQEPWQDIRQAPPAALQLPPPPTDNAPESAAAVVPDAPPQQKPSPEVVAASGRAVGGGNAIEIISSSDEEGPPPQPRGGAVPEAGPSGEGYRTPPVSIPAPGHQPLHKRARLQPADPGPGPAAPPGMALAPPLAWAGGWNAAGQPPPPPPPPGVYGGAGGMPPAGAAPGQAAPGDGQARLNAHSHNNGYAFR